MSRAIRCGLRHAGGDEDPAAAQEQSREIYTAPTVETAEVLFAEFAETWRETYPAMVRSWENSWAEFVPFLEFPIELRKTNGLKHILNALTIHYGDRIAANH